MPKLNTQQIMFLSYAFGLLLGFALPAAGVGIYILMIILGWKQLNDWSGWDDK